MPRILLAFLFIPAISLAASQPSLDSLRAAQQSYVDHFNKFDASALAAFLHPDYSEFAASADTPDLWAARPAAQRTTTFTDLFSAHQTLKLELTSAQYVIAGSTGIVEANQKLTQKPNDGILEYIRTRATFTWVFAADRWRLLAVHRSAPPASAPPAPALAQDPAEARILTTLLATPRWAGVPMVDGRLLRVLAESIQARNVVEVGTSTGFATLWIADALRKTGGHLTTFELDHGRATTARRQFEVAGVSGFVTLIEGDAHKNVAQVKGPLDMVFLDADKDGYLDYLNQLLPLVRPGGLIVAHNMRFPTPSPDYVKAVTTDPNLETIFLNMDDQGAGVTMKKR
ncbi:class I SAM-dependent methyltransferase [uncultured Paludibaculum sp.]|uniref:class I SAM-dependent methyltransferase n=1 Tax=uncultured Paludibaculum sp. TaxID=1765020 RepID=UPI002AAB3D33|nr:class I SAM-dependent methyltransferase [uncultured Paludibaculum sp.]